MCYVNDQFLVDLLVWYHLAWMGETVRRADRRIQLLQDKASCYALHDRRTLLEIIGELLSGIVDRYTHLAERGQVDRHDLIEEAGEQEPAGMGEPPAAEHQHPE